MTNLIFKVQFNGTNVYEMTVLTMFTFGSGNFSFNATYTNYQICFSETHIFVPESNIDVLDTGGLIDNVTLVKMQSAILA